MSIRNYTPWPNSQIVGRSKYIPFQQIAASPPHVKSSSEIPCLSDPKLYCPQLKNYKTSKVNLDKIVHMRNHNIISASKTKVKISDSVDAKFVSPLSIFAKKIRQDKSKEQLK
jgi:hypothetical protein